MTDYIDPPDGGDADEEYNAAKSLKCPGCGKSTWNHGGRQIYYCFESLLNARQKQPPGDLDGSPQQKDKQWK